MKLLAAQLARVNFASDLGGAGPTWLDSRASEHVLAHREKLLGSFAGTQRESARSLLSYVPILAISW